MSTGRMLEQAQKEIDALVNKLAEAEAKTERTGKALYDAAYALYQIKRMKVEAIDEHARTAYDKATAFLDAECLPSKAGS